MESKENKEVSLRGDLSSTGSFVSIPGAFPKASLGVRNALKLEFRTEFDEKFLIKTKYSTDRVLVDLLAMDVESLDFNKLAIDCDLLKAIAQKHPAKIQKMLTHLQKGTAKDLRDFEALANGIGLTEDNFIKNGGGLFFLALVAVAVLSGGCMAHCGTPQVKRPEPPPQPDPK
jgi:hypothetical protein